MVGAALPEWHRIKKLFQLCHPMKIVTFWLSRRNLTAAEIVVPISLSSFYAIGMYVSSHPFHALNIYTTSFIYDFWSALNIMWWSSFSNFFKHIEEEEELHLTSAVNMFVFVLKA